MDIQTLTDLLRAKYPQCGLSEAEIKGMATSLFATGLVTDDNAQQIVDAQTDAIKGLQSVFDARFNARREEMSKTLTETLEQQFRTKYKIDEPKPQPPTAENAINDKLDKALQEMEELKQRLAKADEENQKVQRVASVLQAAEKNGIPREIASHLNVPNDVEDLDSYMKDMSQTLINFGLPSVPPPSEGNEPPTDGQRFAEMIKAGAKQ